MSGDLLWDNVLFLCNFLGADAATAATDESSYGRTITFSGNAQLDTDQYPFVTSSLKLDGSGDFVSVPDDDALSVDTGDFTIEGLFRLNETGRQQTLFNKRDSSSAEEFSVYLNSDNTLEAYLFRSGAAILDLRDAGTTLATGAWRHIAFCRTGTTGYLFLDGVLLDSDTQSNTPSVNTSVFRIGRDGFNTSRDFNGWVGPCRYTKGVNRYTEAFDPPTGIFPIGPYVPDVPPSGSGRSPLLFVN